MTDSTHISASRTIDAPADRVFEVLSNPERHAEIDGSGMVVSDDTSDRITATGQVFTMNMTHPDAPEYQTENHVTGYDRNKMLAWRTAAVGHEPEGWEWLWELAPQGPDATEVTATYDWSHVTDPAVLRQLSFPLVPHSALEGSLGRLAEAVAG